MSRIHGAALRPLTLNENGIGYSYVSVDKHPDVGLVVGQSNYILIQTPGGQSILMYIPVDYVDYIVFPMLSIKHSDK